MDLSFAWDLPPVPECFSKLLIGDSELSSLPSQPWREAERLRELKDVMLKSLAQESVPDIPHAVNGDASVPETEDNERRTVCDENEGASNEENACVNQNEHQQEEKPEKVIDQPHLSQVDESSPTLCRLNTALHSLKKEMADLRHLDMSLFCQLLSLNEAIQDFKMSVGDRYSEYTGSEYTCSEYASSEYSVGGMGSRTGSFSSLAEEGEWGGDFGVHQEGSISSCVASQGVEDMQQQGGVNLAASTSSLLQQIKALTLRAEADF